MVIVTFDTTRYDRFGCTGDPEARTPNADGLAARGALFTRAYATVPLTLPSHTTIMTGLPPLVHGVHNNGRFRVPDDVHTLAERLRDGGYHTGAFVSAFVLDSRFHLDQGFDVYSDDTRRGGGSLAFAVPRRIGEQTTDEAIAWLRACGGERPVFLWVHYYDPHEPREVRPPYDRLNDPYAAAISYADAQLGRLMAEVDAHAGQRGTLIVLTADHGESLGEHDEQTHGLLAYDSTLHVPLIVVGPGIEPGRRSDATVSHLDIAPTVLEAAGLDGGELAGRSLRLASSAPADDDGAAIYFESRGPHEDLGWAIIDGVRVGRWKYTSTPLPPELYDTVADPKEQRNRAAAEPRVAARLDELTTRLRSQARGDHAARPTLSLEDMERLAALGYVEAHGSFGAGSEPDPRKTVAVFGWVDSARSVANAGRYDESIQTLETLAESQAVRPLVLRSLAPVYAESGRYDDAIAAYQAYIALTHSVEAQAALVRTYLSAGRPEQALRYLDALEERTPALGVLRGHALNRLGRFPEARAAVDQAFASRQNGAAHLRARARLVIDAAPIPDGEGELRKFLALAPTDVTLKSWLGYYLAVWGDKAQAEEAWQLLMAGTEGDPRDADAQSNLGWGAFRMGRAEEARNALEKAVALDEQRHLERFRLGIVLHQVGDTQRALALLRGAVAARPAAKWAEDARRIIAEIESNRVATN